MYFAPVRWGELIDWAYGTWVNSRVDDVVNNLEDINGGKMAEMVCNPCIYSNLYEIILKAMSVVVMEHAYQNHWSVIRRTIVSTG